MQSLQTKVTIPIKHTV